MAARCVYTRSSGGSFSWKDEIFFSSNSCKKENTGEGDGMGELREEEIVWGETFNMARTNSSGELGPEEMEASHGDRHGCHRSMLSIEMQAAKKLHSPECGITNLRTSRSEPSIKLHDSLISRAAVSKCSEMEKHHGDDDDDEQNLIITPPHELMARQYSSTPTFSVLHGAGRTLKGMDLRRLRNEVLRQTGFID